MMLVCLTATVGYAQEVLVENGKIIIDAVSYTHLDVYKRQVIGFSLSASTNEIRIAFIFSLF